MELNLKQTLNDLSLAADWVGLRYVRENTTTRHVRDEKPQGNGRHISEGVMVEVLVNGQFGYSATNRLDLPSIQGAAETARQQALAASRWAIHKFNESVRPQAVGGYNSPFVKPLDYLSAGDINDILIKVCQALKASDKIVKTRAMAQTTEIQQQLVSSNGSDVSQHYFLVSTDYSATAMDGTLVQKRSDNGMLARCYQAGLELLNPDDTLERAKIIAQQALELLAAEQCPNTTTDLVLAPDQMMLQIHESIGHPLELDRILGDERNYAGSSFVKLSDFGNLVYGSPLMNVTFDPTVPGEFASYAFDDGGMKADRQYLIEKGILIRGLGGMESQERTKIPGVANLRSSSWNRPPIDRMANLNLEPGNTNFTDMIASIERGVYMESNRSWSIDDYRNKFQFGCEYARLIENGKLTKTLRNPNYRGVTNPFWRSLKAVGDRSTMGIYGTPYCGKGEPNQAIRVGHASPACLFEDVEVFGGVD
ncbi:MAG: Metalloprotease TldD [Chroococcopsis gigantea SAG 12.99]|jgi:predicted Zn-dependent protease|nr:TldD/PmbA family protein [Chlorogloea purpurea SAG 13.99]MDV2999591.1 Metalloprotease TldD [Chroococcopsis gigantea SAG 12.99]